MRLLENAKAALKLPDLRARVIFVFAMFAVYAFGAHVPVPGVDTKVLGEAFAQGFGGGLLKLINLFSGGALKRFSIFALGIMPYINASIIMQLLAVAIPSIEQWQKEGEWGRRRIAKLTRVLTLISSVLQGWGILFLFQQTGAVKDVSLLNLNCWRIVLTLAAGTAALMWIGELITEKGIGNGVSLIIFAGIMMRLPTDVAQVYGLLSSRAVEWTNVFILLGFFVLTVMFIVFVQQAERRIPVQYTRRIVGTRMMGRTSHLPLRVNTAGVIPIIFAISVAMFPGTLTSMIPIFRHGTVITLPLIGKIDMGALGAQIREIFYPGGSNIGLLLYFLLVIAFTYFYTAVVLNPSDLADNLRKWGGVIPGVRPGAPTVQYIDKVLTRITFGGAIFLGIIAILEFLVPHWTGLPLYDIAGGTSILIVVGVALETMLQLEAQLLSRQYERLIR
jgi:preprotein translocase subunit SecY